MHKVIAIPARYGSSRFPGKPLAMLAGKPMLQHVIEHAQTVATAHQNTTIIVTSEDQRILDFAAGFPVQAIRTGDCPSGTDRVMRAIEQLTEKPDVIVNMQGDAPFTPPDFISTLLQVFEEKPHTAVATIATQLSWQALDNLRQQKLDSPFSGTTVVRNPAGEGVWFSKQIIPANRKEEQQRTDSDLSPVLRHIGLYGYSYQALANYLTWPESTYEKLEGLEQLRFLEHGVPIQVALVDYQGRPAMSGVDTPEDLARAEALLQAAQASS